MQLRPALRDAIDIRHRPHIAIEDHPMVRCRQHTAKRLPIDGALVLLRCQARMYRYKLQRIVVEKRHHLQPLRRVVESRAHLHRQLQFRPLTEGLHQQPHAIRTRQQRRPAAPPRL